MSKTRKSGMCIPRITSVPLDMVSINLFAGILKVVQNKSNVVNKAFVIAIKYE